MILDARGLELSESDRDAVDAIDVCTARLLRLENGVEVILKAGEEHPESPMTMLLCGAFHLFAQTEGGNATAVAWLGKFEPTASNDRGRMLHRALTAWHDGEYLSAVEGMEAITGRWPADLLTAKFAEFLYYVLGQQHMGARFRAHMDRIADAHPDDTDFLGMRAFSEELCGDFEAAEKSAVQALKLEERNAWAQHALSHVLIRMGRIDEGRARLQAFLPELPGFQRLIHSHDAWHLALLHLEDLDSAAALDVYRNHVWGFAPDLVGEQIDAISLLWRMEMAGFEVDDEWADVAAHSAARAGETFMPFLSAHHLYAFVRGGEEEAAKACLEAVRDRAARTTGEGRRVWARAGAPIVEAVGEFARGNYARAAEILDPVMPDMTMIGGSDAQDDLFRQTYLRALQRAGRTADVRAYFEKICEGKGLTPLDRKLAA